MITQRMSWGRVVLPLLATALLLGAFASPTRADQPPACGVSEPTLASPLDGSVPGTINVSWNAVVPGVPGTVTYDVKYKNGGTTINHAGITGTSDSATGLGSGTWNVTIKTHFNPDGTCSGQHGAHTADLGAVTFGAPTLADQTITVTTPAPGTAVYGSTFDVAADSDSGLSVAITTSGVCSGSGADSATVTMTSGTGTCTVHYNQGGDSNFNPAPEVTSPTAAAKADAVIVVTPFSGVYDALPHGVTGSSATGISNADLSLELHVDNTTYTNVPGGPVNWTFDGDANYNSANGTVTVVISKADANCSSIAGYTVTYDGSAHTATGSCLGVLGETLSGLDLSGTTHTNAGTYPDSWTFTDVTGNYNNTGAPVTDTINKANAVCTIVGYAVLYDGNPHTATGSCVGVGSDGVVDTLDLSGTTHTAGGGYTDPWTFTSITGNYNNQSSTVNDVIIAPQAPITLSNKSFQSGSTIPVKIASTIAGWPVMLFVCKGVANVYPGGATCKNAVSSGGSNVLNQFRYDVSGKQYIYNLSTKLTTVFTGVGQYSLWITISGVIIPGPFKLATITIK